MDIGALRKETWVNIQRSNGRLQSAMISGVDTAKQFVSVEWFENGETKGKEVDLVQIYSLNAHLFEKPQTAIPDKPKSVPKHPASVDRRTIATPSVNNSKQKLNHLKSVENVVGNPNLIPKVASALPVRAQERQAAVSRGGPVNGRQAVSIVGESGSERQVPLSRGGPVSERQAPLSKGGPGSDRQAPLSRGGPGNEHQAPLPKAAAGIERIQQPPPPQLIPQQPIKENAVKPRKSNCVKEVEKLKKNRQERRAKQADQIANRFVDIDAGSPNWEFAQKIREFLSKIDINPLTTIGPVTNNRICVCVRKRPLNKKELSRKEIDVVTVPDVSSVLIHEPKVKVDLTKFLENQAFCFDYSFDQEVTNEVVYHYTAKPLVETIFNRGMATCFAYGQTGSGKTHTMGGVFQGKQQDATNGIYALAAADVFHLLSQSENVRKGLAVSASFFELYSGKVYDLLNLKQRLRILEDAKQQVQVVGLTEQPVENVQDVLQLIDTGNTDRTSGTTSANQNSSRSHAVFQIIIRKVNTGKLYGKFSLIDLAGNERGADTANSDRQTRMEGAEINKSLLALKECIRALGRKGAHLPFRGSKLTQVLKDSFVGDNSRTCMIAMVSPGLNSCEHTINTLRYADRVKELRSNQGGGGGGAAISVSVVPAKQQPSSEAVQPPAAGGLGDVQSGGGYAQDHHPTSPARADLQYLYRNIPNGDHHQLEMDKSAELLSFQEAFDNVVESEEQLIDEHKAIIQEDEQLLEEERQLLHYVENVDRDIDEYVRNIERIVTQKVERFSQFKERILELRQRLVEEETASRNVKHLPPVF